MKKVLRNAGETIRFVNSMIDFVKIRKEVYKIREEVLQKSLTCVRAGIIILQHD